MNRGSREGLTLIELLVAISLTVIILGAVYYSLTSALESWSFSRDELAVQQVLSTVLEEMQEGTDFFPGLRSALELTRAWEDQVELVPPVSEERPVSGGRQGFQLSHYARPGTGLPIAELRLPDTEGFRPIPIAWEDPDNLTDRPRVRPSFELVPGSTLRLSYHPDPDRVPEVLVTFGWDPESKSVFRERLGERERIGFDLFGVEVTECRFRYLDSANAALEGGGDVGEAALPLVSAIEVTLTGRLGSHTLTLKGMTTLRNSPRQSGLLLLRRGLKVEVPGSRAIRTLYLTNLTGISHEDEIQLEFRPRMGRVYRVTLRFERYGEIRPVIAQVTVEYPPGNPIFTDRPRTSADQGLDLLTLGPAGLYDYDDDPKIEDGVLLEEEPIVLYVTKQDPLGAALFAQP